MVREYICAQCGHRARDKHNLTRHKLTHVPDDLKCRFCKTSYTTEEEVREHLNTCKKGVSCFHCQERLGNKETLVTHIKNNHSNDSKSIRLQCPLCPSQFSRFSHSDAINSHLTRYHGQSLKKTRLTFDNEEDFHRWKADVEISSHCAYVKLRGCVKSSSEKKYVYFNCSRHGLDRPIPEESRKRRRSLLLPRKINAYCPARIVVRVVEKGKVEVIHVSTHLGHDPEHDASRRRLSRAFRVFKTKDRGEQLTGDVGLQEDVMLDENDAVSVQKWVEKNLKSSSPWVRYYKFHGDLDPNYPELPIDDFILILMNDTQRQSLLEFGKNMVCISGTQGTNGYGYYLTTLLVLDDHMEGLPVASMFSSRSDAATTSFFFDRLRDLCGEINCNVFMSDITDMYFQSWVTSMGIPKSHLFCSCFVDRDWQKNLNKVKGDKPAKKYVFQKIKAVQMEIDIQTFTSMFSNLIHELLSKTNTELFGEYLRDEYSSNTENWAYCYRVHAGLNTNTHLERINGIFTYLQSRESRTTRLDKAIHALNVFIRDKFMDEFISSNNGRLSHQMQTIRRKHCMFQKERNALQIVPLHSNEWLVSSVTLYDLYSVLKVRNICEWCHLRCDLCGTCAHMFVCSCIDSAVKGQMCKHIHKVCSDLSTENCVANVVFERPNDDFLLVSSDNSNENVLQEKNGNIQEVPSHLTTFSQKLEEAVERFRSVARKAVSEEQLAEVNKAVASLDASLSGLQQKETSSKLEPSPAVLHSLQPDKVVLCRQLYAYTSDARTPPQPVNQHQQKTWFINPDNFLV